MANYLTTIEFAEEESMRTLLVAAKLALDPEVWRKATNDAFIDEDELTIWTEAERYKPVEALWDYIFNTFDWCESGFEEPDQSEIEISEYFEDCATNHNTTSRIDHLVELPNIEFEHNLYQGNINTFLSNVRQGEAA